MKTSSLKGPDTLTTNKLERFLSAVITILLVFWILRWVFALVGPWLLSLFAKRLMKKAGFTPPPSSGSAKTDSTSKTDTVKSDKWWKPDEVILKPHRQQGQRLSDILGGEYVDCQEVD